jgi:putative spermidine/putrescine transport system ATP-binding protein
MSHLALEHLEKRYAPGLAPAVEALSLTVEKGQLLGLLGPSGCGKTTTLRMIGGLTPSTAGHIRVAGNDVTPLPPYRRDMGIVFQNYALFPHMSVAENVAFGLQMRKIPRRDIAPRVNAALEMVRLPHLASRRPKELSGGQQQRVALARALVIQPSILLLDEPLSNLDAKLRDEMRTEIRDIQQRLGITTIFVTHDQVEALAMCDLIAVMNAGRLEQLGTPHAIYEHPASRFVADFVGRTTSIDAIRATPELIETRGFTFKAPPGPVGAVTAMIRPHRIAIGRAPGSDWNQASGTVTRVTYIGDQLAIAVRVAEHDLTLEQPTQPGSTPPIPGAPIDIAWRISDTLVFPR